MLVPSRHATRGMQGRPSTRGITGVGVLLALTASAQLVTLAGSEVPSSDVPTSTSSQFLKFTHIVEWDIPALGDVEPGAITVDSHGRDNNRVWFLTRTGAQKAYRFDPARSLMRGSAQWTSWQLSQTPPLSTTGGLKRLKPSDDRRFLFVRTSDNLQRVDTHKCTSGTLQTAFAPATPPTCELTVWQDQPFNLNVSDLAVDSANRVFTTATPLSLDINSSYVQMLIPGSAPLPTTTATAKVKRWTVRGGAGFCATAGSGGPCLSGIDVHSSKYKDLVYYSEPEGNNIGELNVATNVVRRWSLAKVNASEPRQLNIDRQGKVWVVTGSDHIVSLDPSNNKMTSHQVPVTDGFADSDLFGVAPDDDVIGYTNAGFSENKVAMLFPKGNAVSVTPTRETLPPVWVEVPVMSERSVVESDSVRPQGKIAPVMVTAKNDGTFVEARVDLARCESSWCSPVASLSPRGITPNRGKAQGTFFYAVGFSDAVRIGFARLPHRERIKHGRDDDDCDDGEDASMHPDWHDHDSHPDDEDDDGVDSKHDTRTSREDSETRESSALSAGQAGEYPIIASATSLALIASVVADDPLARIGVDIYNALGALVASGVSVGGVALATLPAPPAGNYRVRVTNQGLAPVNQTPTLVVREPWLW
jgi:hypothetical protein